MAYLTTQELLEYRPQAGMLRFSSLDEARSRVALTVFISHSHDDKPYVQSLLGLFHSAGISAYVDWNDTGMPRVRGRDTAERIKVKIKEHAVFLVLATPKALASRWVPWEVGIADQVKEPRAILVFPVVDPGYQFRGNEYLALYNRFEKVVRLSQRIPPSPFRIIAPNGSEVGGLVEHLSTFC